MANQIANFLRAFQNGLGYTYLTEHSYEMKKDDIADIAKELIFAIEDADLLEIDREKISSILEENLIM